MAFICPECLGPGLLEITRSIHLPPDSRSDDIVLQILACDQCDFRGVAVYEESRRGALDSEVWEHTGYRAPAERVAGLEQQVAACPRPVDSGCGCASHRALARPGDGGRRELPFWVESSPAFPMRLAP